MSHRTKAGLLLIGDELLSGKIRDENGHMLAKLLRRRGIQLVEISVVGDDRVAIGQALLRFCRSTQIVFTSGGVGPTHDDVTLQAVAKALERPLERHAQLESKLRRHYGSEINDAALSMADLPRGTELCADRGWPVLRLHLDTCRVYILPGVPSLFALKIEQLAALDGELPVGEPWHLTRLHTSLDESQLAPLLDRLGIDFPDVQIGSYPRVTQNAQGSTIIHVRVTLEAPQRHANAVQSAKEALAHWLGTALISEELDGTPLP